MERLTKKQDDGKYYISQLSIDNSYKNGFNSFYGKPIDKLAEFEDFMEEQGFESLEELKKCFEIWNSEDDNGFLKDTDNKKLFLYRFAKNLFRYEKDENKALKDRWQKLKEWASYLCYFELVDKMEELEKE